MRGASSALRKRRRRCAQHYADVGRAFSRFGARARTLAAAAELHVHALVDELGEVNDRLLALRHGDGAPPRGAACAADVRPALLGRRTRTRCDE